MDNHAPLLRVDNLATGYGRKKVVQNIQLEVLRL
jgi:hypothetical protein